MLTLAEIVEQVHTIMWLHVSCKVTAAASTEEKIERGILRNFGVFC